MKQIEKNRYILNEDNEYIRELEIEMSTATLCIENDEVTISSYTGKNKIELDLDELQAIYEILIKDNFINIDEKK